MNEKVLVGTLIGPQGETVGRFVRYEDHHLLTVINDYARGLMADLAASLRDAIEVIEVNHQQSGLCRDDDHEKIAKWELQLKLCGSPSAKGGVK